MRLCAFMCVCVYELILMTPNTNQDQHIGVESALPPKFTLQGGEAAHKEKVKELET